MAWVLTAIFILTPVQIGITLSSPMEQRLFPSEALCERAGWLWIDGYLTRKGVPPGTPITAQTQCVQEAV